MNSPMPARRERPQLQVVSSEATILDGQWALDYWDAGRLGIPARRGPGAARFGGISRPWLRDPVKRWSRFRLATGCAFATIDAGALAADGRRLDRHGAGRIVRTAARRAGITKTVTPHTPRHAFITTALDAGVPLRDVQEAVSHADPRTTMRYNRPGAAWTGTRPISPPTSQELPLPGTPAGKAPLVVAAAGRSCLRPPIAITTRR